MNMNQQWRLDQDWWHPLLPLPSDKEFVYTVYRNVALRRLRKETRTSMDSLKICPGSPATLRQFYSMKCLLSVNVDSSLASGRNGLKFTKAGNRIAVCIWTMENPWRLIQGQEPHWLFVFAYLCRLASLCTTLEVPGVESLREKSMENSISNSHPSLRSTWRKSSQQQILQKDSNCPLLDHITIPESCRAATTRNRKKCWAENYKWPLQYNENVFVRFTFVLVFINFSF